MKHRQPRVLIVTGYGVNCEAESAYAWELAGARPVKMHLNDLLAAPRQLDRYQALMFIGGFSFGDHMGSGHVLALRWRHCLRDELCRFLARGRLALGICNGFQVMVKLGLLPGLNAGKHAAAQPGAHACRLEQQAALTHNQGGVFQNFWVTIRFDPRSPCVFTRGLDRMDIPIRHGEGRLYAPAPGLLDALERRSCIPCRYAHPRTGRPTMRYPHNPNGSQRAIAGLCSRDGRVFGMMPHPEAYLFPENHPQWPRQKLAGTLPHHGAGLAVFKNAVDYLQ